MNRIFLLLALIVGIALAYVVLKPSEEQEQEQAHGSWNLYEELDRDAAANRPGWR
ncbi:hypothetical protein DFO67_104369 [Modicisalibacter xianhensis]|uniref:Uncharacterized protein n=1 Tax=Modicisalibacter xianhensis TaxID=442341 RepID=A0A4R8FW57_9GAMM|nr:hypothetical protein [Halomonas xianhensis]TDX31104.1 hypothetical protein DFO67_104369 [Halomonas xianhensis]